ncbi:hypothetical protein JEQ12_014324, partial [Ovis aries]
AQNSPPKEYESDDDFYDMLDLTEYVKRHHWWNPVFGHSSGPVVENHSVATQIVMDENNTLTLLKKSQNNPKISNFPDFRSVLAQEKKENRKLGQSYNRIAPPLGMRKEAVQGRTIWNPVSTPSLNITQSQYKSDRCLEILPQRDERVRGWHKPHLSPALPMSSSKTVISCSPQGSEEKLKKDLKAEHSVSRCSSGLFNRDIHEKERKTGPPIQSAVEIDEQQQQVSSKDRESSSNGEKGKGLSPPFFQALLNILLLRETFPRVLGEKGTRLQMSNSQRCPGNGEHRTERTPSSSPHHPPYSGIGFERISGNVRRF